jgi:hypothetical protein
MRKLKKESKKKKKERLNQSDFLNPLTIQKIDLPKIRRMTGGTMRTKKISSNGSFVGKKVMMP